MDRRAGYVTLAMLLKISENSSLPEKIKNEYKQNVNGQRSIIKTYTTTSDKLCREPLRNFNKKLKINKTHKNNKIQIDQRYVITTIEPAPQKKLPTELKYLKYKEKYLKLKKELSN
jgi:hypothetical protein